MMHYNEYREIRATRGWDRWGRAVHRWTETGVPGTAAITMAEEEDRARTRWMHRGQPPLPATRKQSPSATLVKSKGNGSRKMNRESTLLSDSSLMVQGSFVESDSGEKTQNSTFNISPISIFLISRKLCSFSRSRERFGEVHAKQWWDTNRDRIQAQYLS